MPTKGITWNTVCELGLALPDVEEGTTYGSPALKIGGKLLACIPNHKSAEPGSLAVRIPFADRDELLVAEPKTYYVKEHYANYPCVLLRLAHIRRDALKDLLLMAHRFVSTSATKRRSRTRSAASSARGARRTARHGR